MRADAPPKKSKKSGNSGPPPNLEIDVQRLSIQEFRNITENFSQKYLIGEGSFGRVYVGQMNARDVAVKKLEASALPEEEFLEAVRHGQLKHGRAISFQGRQATS